MKKLLLALGTLTLTGLLTPSAHAIFMSVAGPNSSDGTAPAIIAAPANALDDNVTNTGMQGFNEAQGVMTTVIHSIDSGGTIPVGTLVNSHMIFLNNAGSTFLSHTGVTWTFSDMILGVMSDSGGFLEAASTFELGAPGTNYIVGPGAAPFAARGMEGGDSYVVAGNTITVNMQVTEPGDWIRVVTASTVPEPGTILLLGSGLAGLGLWRWNREKAS